jgi:short-subunit dehydrogenase
MRAELAKDNIVVTTVTPGLMRTGSSRHATVQRIRLGALPADHPQRTGRAGEQRTAELIG